jgi:plastocyanin
MASPNSGDGQTGTVTLALADPLAVLVTKDGKPKAGVSVTWSSSGTGGSISNPTVTDGNGIAQSTWRLAQQAGQQTATAELDGADGSPISFTATANASTPVSLSKGPGDNQTQEAGSPFPDILQVKALDRFGNGVPGVQVNWAVTSGAVTLEVSSNSTGTAGVAGNAATAGASAGPAVVTATSFYGTATFNLTVTAGTLPVEIGDDFFRSTVNATQDPAIDTVGVGTTVQWTKSGVNQHHIVSTSGPVAFDSGLLKGGTGTGYSLTFNTAGDYTYQCAIHTTMTGEIVVQ